MKLNTKALKEVEIGIPIIQEGVYHARLDKVELKPNKAGDGQNLYIMVKVLDNPVQSKVDGKEIQNQGQVVCSRYISMQSTDTYDPNKALKELAVAINHPENEDLEETHLKDKIVMVKIGWQDKRKDEKTGKEYAASNTIDRFTPVPAEDTFTPPPF